MKKEELAAMLTGREYRNEITKEECILAKDNHLVVVFGASDDLMEFRGAVHDELGAYDGGVAYFTEFGLLLNECDDERCPHYKRLTEKAHKVEAEWCPKNLDCTWLMKSNIPHSSFDILEDGELYCRGLVFSLKELKEDNKKEE